MVAEVLDIEQLVSADKMASSIANQWVEWNNLRQKWVEEKKELRNYLYATDTRTTGNAILPWSNSTTTPKLTQIMDNLHANYFYTTFPNRSWLRWEASDSVSARPEKVKYISNYVMTKVRRSGFINTSSQLLLDYIQYGNCFARVDYLSDVTFSEDGTFYTNYTGPKMSRISPLDIVFNPVAESFADSPKIIRYLMTLGDIAKKIQQGGEGEKYRPVFEKMIEVRKYVAGHEGNVSKSEAFIADGFSSIEQYYGSDYVEILEFVGDYFDRYTGQLGTNRRILIADRAYIIADEETKGHIFHAGWRQRPDNLYAMGPLDNLVGMQYRIDHLENLRADVFDQIAYPVLKIKGNVEHFEFEPGARAYIGEEGDVGYLAPDATALQADLQIQILENKMEELAGAPRQAMGIRTPGEKTAFEVQTLENSASRIFQHKTAHWERSFLEPIINAMLVIGRDNLDLTETIEVLDKDLNVTTYVNIERQDIEGDGRIIPIGARHFAERARRIQNLVQLNNVKLSDPTVTPHLSGKRMAEILATELGEEELYEENVAIKEQMATQEYSQNQMVDSQERQQIAAENGL